MSINVGVPRAADFVGVDGHLVLAITLDLGLFVNLSSDTLALEGTLRELITFAEAVATLEASEFVVTVRAERTWLEAVP